VVSELVVRFLGGHWIGEYNPNGGQEKGANSHVTLLSDEIHLQDETLFQTDWFVG
jgi:hypothetical protein